MASLIQSDGSLSRFPSSLFIATIAGGAWREPLPPLDPMVAADADVRLPKIEAPQAYTDAQTKQLRRHVLWLRRSGREFLAAGELAFLGYLARWGRPLTIDQGDRVMTLVDRVDDQQRGRL